MSVTTSEVPREKLRQLVEKNGEILLKDPDRCEGLLKDHCGAHRKEISALVGAVEERVPLELKSSWQVSMTPEAMRARLVQRLEENRGLAPEVASWAVDAWSYALGVDLGRTSDRIENNLSEAAGPLSHLDRNARFASAPDSMADRVASDRPGGSASAQNANRRLGSTFGKQKLVGILMAILLLTGGAWAAYRVYQYLQHLHHHQSAQYNPPKPPQPKPVPPNPGPNPPKRRPGPIQPAPPSIQPQPPVRREVSGYRPQGFSAPPDPSPAPPPQPAVYVPAGTTFAVRLDQSLNTMSLVPGEILSATVASPVAVNGSVVVATDARARLKVIALDQQPHKAVHLQLALVQVSTLGGPVHVVTTSRSFTGPVTRSEVVKRAGIGAAAGAVGGFLVGHLFHHGGAGAAAGAAGGATVGAVTSKPGPVKLPAETLLQFQLVQAVSVKGPTNSGTLHQAKF